MINEDHRQLFVRDALSDAMNVIRRYHPAALNIRADFFREEQVIEMCDLDSPGLPPLVKIHLRRPDQDDSETAPYTLEIQDR